VLVYLKYVHAASANNRIVMIQSDELLIPVFLAMDSILSLIALLCEAMEQRTGLLVKKGDYTHNRVNECNRDFASVKVWPGFALWLLAVTAHQEVTHFTDRTRSFVSN
jgi:hypothetical protein